MLAKASESVVRRFPENCDVPIAAVARRVICATADQRGKGHPGCLRQRLRKAIRCSQWLVGGHGFEYIRLSIRIARFVDRPGIASWTRVHSGGILFSRYLIDFCGKIVDAQEHEMDTLKRLAGRYIWWKSPDEAAAMPARVMAQVMNLGDYEDVQILARHAGDAALRDVLTHAEAGQFNERSWAYWHYRLGLADVDQVPPMPSRKFA